MTAVSMPHCLKCKMRWMAMVDFRGEQDAARKRGASYILDGSLHDDLQDLITLTQLQTMAEATEHLRNAKVMFEDKSKGDGTASPALRAVSDVISWLENWHTEVKADYEEKKKDRGKNSGGTTGS